MNVDFAKEKDIVSISTINSKGELINIETLGKVSLNVIKDKVTAPLEGSDFRKGCTGSLNLVHSDNFFNVFSTPFNYIEFMTEYEERVLKPYLKHKRREKNRKKLHDKKPKRRKVRR